MRKKDLGTLMRSMQVYVLRITCSSLDYVDMYM